jgi:hypothetical protein
LTSKALGGRVAYPVGDGIEPGQIGELPADEPVTEVLYPLAPALLVFGHAGQVVLAETVSLTHHVPLGEEEVDSGDEAAKPITKLGLQGGRREIAPPHRQATQRFENRLAAAVAEFHRRPRTSGARPTPAVIQHIAQLAHRDDPASQGCVGGGNGFGEAVLATKIDYGPGNRGDRYPPDRVDVCGRKASAVQMYRRLVR